MEAQSRFKKLRASFRYRLLLGFSVPLIIWLIVSGINIVSLNESVMRSERLIDSQRTILRANQYVNAALGALAAKRGYIITSNMEFLVPYRRATNQLNRLHAEIARLSSDDPDQQERIEQAGDLIQRWLHDVANERIAARRQLSAATLQDAYDLEDRLLALQEAHLRMDDIGPPDRELLSAIRSNIHSLMQAHPAPQQRRILEQALMQMFRYAAAASANDRREMEEAIQSMNSHLTRTIQQIIEADGAIRAIVSSDEGDILLREFQQLMNRFIETEEQALEQHRRRMVNATDRTHILLRAGPALGLIFMILITSWIASRIGRSIRSVSRAAGELAHGNLNARARVKGGDEFAILADRFNVMAELVGNRSRESAALADLGELLQSCSTMNEAARVFSQFAPRILPGHGGVLYLMSPGREMVTAVVTWGGGDAYSVPEFAPDECWALRLGRTQRSRNGSSIRCDHMQRNERENICLPLHAFGDTIGLLLVVLPVESVGKLAMEQQHEDFLETVAEQLALALANLRLRETLRNQSVRDPLTGLYNRRYLDESFRRELHRATRHGTALSVLTFDIDHFKRFNDEHGHDGGDAVLRAVGHCLQEFFRTEDGAYRSGGEEFVAVLADTELSDAVARAEDLCEQISRMDVHHEDVLLPPITISVGVASYPAHGLTTDQLLRSADQALYRAKEGGRNRVVAANGTP